MLYKYAFLQDEQEWQEHYFGTMDLLKTPSVQSLLDSDLESVGSLQYLDIEEVNTFIKNTSILTSFIVYWYWNVISLSMYETL